MDFRFSEEEERFRQEVREFIKKERRPGLLTRMQPETEEEAEYYREMKLKLGAKSWHSLSWPKEFGGQGNLVKQFIVSEEFYFSQTPGVDIVSDNMVAPVLIQFGTEEQKREHLPKIAQGELTWCQGFSEPGAGSDLFAMSTRAVEQDDLFIINGQKVWTSGASISDWIFLLARTEPDPALKHRGISAFLVDLRMPGVTVHPLQTFAGAFYAEDFFDNVKVPKKNLVGKKNQGAQVSLAMLGHERSGIHRIKYGQANLARVIEYAKETKRDGIPLIEHPLIQQKLANLVIEGEVAQLFGYRVLALQMQGKEVDVESSMSRLAGTLFQQHVGSTAMEILGQYGLLEPGSKLAILQGALEQEYLWSVTATVGAGTAEIQRNTIAVRGLNLPRA